MQILGERRRAGVAHGLMEPDHARSDLAVFLILAAVSFAVGFEAAPLVEMEKSAADVMQGQRLVQRLRAQLERIEHGQRFAFGAVRREQTR
jgi:hypothetical protein